MSGVSARSRTPLTSRQLALVMGFACAAGVANIYYSQPLLELIARDFDVTQSTASLVVTLTQVGYALGMVFLVPLGDLFENRKLITTLLLFTAASLMGAALSPVFTVFLAMAVLVGLTSCIVQIIVPFAAHVAPKGQEGSFVGTVMGCLMVGILLARSISSGVAELTHWRTIFVISAVGMVLLSVLLRRVLPEQHPTTSMRYADSLRSAWNLLRTDSALARRSLAHAAIFGSFTVFWTAIAYQLIDVHGLSQGEIALFALAGVAGALAAPLAGKWADRGWGRGASLAMIATTVVGFALGGFGGSSVWLLLAAGIIVDFGVQGHQILGQAVIYRLHPGARARVTTVYMSSVFVGGALASAAAGFAYHHGGWSAVSWLGSLLPLIAFGAWWLGRKDPRGA